MWSCNGQPVQSNLILLLLFPIFASICILHHFLFRRAGAPQTWETERMLSFK